MHRQRGFTLLELLVVLAIIGFAMAAVSLSLRNTTQTQLEREAQRLIAVLEAARAQSRTSGVALIWQSTPEGFVIRPANMQANMLQTPATANSANPLAPRTEAWLSAGTQAIVTTAGASANNTSTVNTVVLGPEPILTPVRITLSAAPTQNVQTTPTLSLGTDGLRPFQVVP
jgi:general secretion pathway protein H